MNYFKCRDYPCLKVKELLKATDKIGYLYGACKALQPSYLESLSKTELQCDLCKMETVLEEIANGTTSYPNSSVVRFISDHTILLMIYMDQKWWKGVKFSLYTSVKQWIQLLLSNKNTVIP